MQRYGAILADPPWPYDNQQSHNPARGGYTYPSMTLDEIKALPIRDLAAKDCALFLWATMPKLREALEVIEAWGFRYTSCAFVWVKLNPKSGGIYSGLGYWTNGNAELCLLAKRGAPKRLARDVKQIVLAPRGRHSEKPSEVRMRIERLVDGPYLELFARQRHPGWDCWGNEVDSTVMIGKTLTTPVSLPPRKNCGRRLAIEEQERGRYS